MVGCHRSVVHLRPRWITKDGTSRGRCRRSEEVPASMQDRQRVSPSRGYEVGKQNLGNGARAGKESVGREVPGLPGKERNSGIEW